jgi:PRC-barrel domain
MIRTLVVVMAFSGVMAGLAHSQETSPASSAKFVTSQTTEQWVFSRFNGTDVVGPDNVSVGNVNDLLFDRDGKVIGLIVGVGGFLGIGTKNVAMDMSAFDVVPISIVNTERDNTLPGARLAGSAKDPTHVKLKVSWTKDQLKEAPSFAYFEPATSATTTGP